MKNTKNQTNPEEKSALKDWLIIVPARLKSTRLHEKPLQDLKGKPLIIRTLDNLSDLKEQGATILIATDDEKIVTTCRRYHYEAQLTSPNLLSGTDRCWEVSQSRPASFILNVQCDEPFISRSDLLRLTTHMQNQKSSEIGTLVYHSSDFNDFNNPNVVKAIRTKDDFALYFTRAPCPVTRDIDSSTHACQFWHHQGVYAFRREALQRFCSLPPSPLELTEKLEQLRALENGIKICLVTAEFKSDGIDSPKDLEDARARL